VLNRWTKALKPVVPRRIEAASRPPLAVGARPKIGHLPRPIIPRRFYVELDVNDLHMLVVPPAFRTTLGSGSKYVGRVRWPS
jgi:hypothetical protein